MFHSCLIKDSSRSAVLSLLWHILHFMMHQMFPTWLDRRQRFELSALSTTLDLSNHRTAVLFASVPFKWVVAQRRCGVSGSCSAYLNWIWICTYMCRWNSGLCSHTMIHGSVPECMQWIPCQSCQFLMEYHLRAQRSQPSTQWCSPDSLNLLMIFCTLDDGIFKELVIFVCQVTLFWTFPSIYRCIFPRIAEPLLYYWETRPFKMLFLIPIHVTGLLPINHITLQQTPPSVPF